MTEGKWQIANVTAASGAPGEGQRKLVAACPNLFGSKLVCSFRFRRFSWTFVTSELKRFAVGNSQFSRESHGWLITDLSSVIWYAEPVFSAARVICPLQSGGQASVFWFCWRAVSLPTGCCEP